MRKKALIIFVGILLAVFIVKLFIPQKPIVQATKNLAQPHYVSREIVEGESIYQVLLDLGLTNTDVARYTMFMGEYVDISTIQIGDSLKVLFESDSTATADSLLVKRQKVAELIYKPDLITSHILHDRGDSLIYKLEQAPVETKNRLVQGTITKTLDAALLENGLEPGVKQQVNNALEAEVAFSTDARVGDRYQVLIEEHFFNNIKLPRSKVLYASYSGKRAKFHEAFRFDDTDKASSLNGMYNPTGKALVQNSVRSPLNSLHVTSSFGNRIHPITGRWQMHQGIDYRARTGTPVYAVAPGKVIKTGYNGGFGKEVRLRHANGAITQYAHLSSIYVKRGQNVAKGSKIAASGSTGLSSGPHLHFGLMEGGRWINPKKLKMVGAIRLTEVKLKEFKIQMQNIQKLLNEQLSGAVASN